MKIYHLLTFFIITLFSIDIFSEEYEAIVLKVIDGDTIHIGSNKIRLQGINAPELEEPYGKQAKWALHKLVKGQTITAQPNGEESYGRIVAKCYLEDGRDLVAEMVKMGLALDLPNYPDADYKHLETPASRKKLSWKPPKKEETEE